MIGIGDEAIPASRDDSGAPGLEGLPRVDIGALETSVPSVVEAAATGPIILTRNGSDAFVLLPLDAYSRLWSQAPRPPVIDMAGPTDT
jgi:hypothetical protein